MDAFSTSITLQTDDDSPSAAIFRLPNERLLDNDIHLRNRTSALEDRADDTDAQAAEFEALLELDFVINEDFAGAIFDDAESRLDASFPWRTNQTGLVAVNHSAGTAKNPGQLVVSVPGDGVGDQYFEFHVGANTGTPLDFVMPNRGLSVEIVVKVTEHVDNLNEQIRFGLVSDAGALNGGDDALVIWRARAVDADHWMVLRRVGGVQTNTVLTAAPFANGEYAVWRLQSLDLGDIAISFNGAVVQTVLLAGLPDPGVGCNVSCWASTSVADTELLTVAWDRIRVASDPGDRSGA